MDRPIIKMSIFLAILAVVILARVAWIMML